MKIKTMSSIISNLILSGNINILALYVLLMKDLLLLLVKRDQKAYFKFCSLFNQRTNGPVNAHLSLLHIPINMFEYYGI